MSRVLALWARGGRGGAFTLRYPAYVRRLSVVANGRLLASARPVAPDAESFRFDLGAG